MMSAGLMCTAATLGCAAMAPTFEVLVIARVVSGLFAATIPALAFTYAAEVFDDRYRPTGITAISACFLLAGILGQAYSIVVDAALGLRWVFGLLVPVLLVSPVMFATAPVAPPSRTSRGVARGFRSLRDVAGLPRLYPIYYVASILLLSLVGMYGALNHVASASFGLSSASDHLLLRLPGLPAAVAGALWASLVIRRGARAQRVAGAGLALAAIGLFLEAIAPTVLLVMTASGLYVIGLAVAMPATITLLGLASGTARPFSQAVYGFLVAVGASMAPVLLGPASGLGLGAVCLVLVLLLGFGLAMMVWYPSISDAGTGLVSANRSALSAGIDSGDD